MQIYDFSPRAMVWVMRKHPASVLNVGHLQARAFFFPISIHAAIHFRAVMARAAQPEQGLERRQLFGRTPCDGQRRTPVLGSRYVRRPASVARARRRFRQLSAAAPRSSHRHRRNSDLSAMTSNTLERTLLWVFFFFTKKFSFAIQIGFILLYLCCQTEQNY